ncbi:MAG: acyl-ACP--UDP-N-acetylglucosamine O-acyltransferase [Flavobacteriales bacterium]|nr:acyl-ACP--UDP-N-acetylglucosamine O-acyltransferase [Flavobacteriales bacterium]
MKTASLIHDQCFVHPDAKIGEGVEIGPFTSVAGDVVIGDGTWIGPNVSILDGARIGKNCKIFPGAVISAEPQDLKFEGEITTAEIGDSTIIRECCTINRGTRDRMTTRVGNNCLLMAYTHIAHDVLVGNNCIIANSANIAGHVVIEDFVVIEGVVAVQQFVRIGQHSFLAGGSLVRKNVPPFVKAAREPLSFVGVNTIGLRRRGFDTITITEIEDLYRAIYVHNNNLSQALKAAEVEFPASAQKSAILDFIQASDKGIIRGPQ